MEMKTRRKRREMRRGEGDEKLLQGMVPGLGAGVLSAERKVWPSIGYF